MVSMTVSLRLKSLTAGLTADAPIDIQRRPEGSSSPPSTPEVVPGPVSRCSKTRRHSLMQDMRRVPKRARLDALLDAHPRRQLLGWCEHERRKSDLRDIFYHIADWDPSQGDP